MAGLAQPASAPRPPRGAVCGRPFRRIPTGGSVDERAAQGGGAVVAAATVLGRVSVRDRRLCVIADPHNMGPVCRTSTPAPTACFNPRIHQPLSPLVHSALPPTLVRPPLLEYATSSFYTSGTPGFLSGMVPRPSGMRCGSVGSATDAGSVSEGRASDDVDPPYEPGGWVPVPDVVGRAGRRVGACGVCVDSVLRRVRDSAGSVPGQGAGRPEQRQRRRGRGAGERGTPVPDARNVAGPDHRGAAGPTPGTPRG